MKKDTGIKIPDFQEVPTFLFAEIIGVLKTRAERSSDLWISSLRELLSISKYFEITAIISD